MKKWWIWLIAAVVAAAGGWYAWHAATRPLSLGAPNISVPAQTTRAATLAWPAEGRAAVGFAAGGGASCRSFGDAAAQPTASLAKVITALVVLGKYPLNNGDGPLITMTNDDVARLFDTQANNGSYVPIVAGEQLSERQMLQALMLASANNLADSLAIWAFGSLDDYRTAAESWLAQDGLLETTIGADASGFDPGTKSTASDLCKLALLVAKNQTLADIMGTIDVSDFPVVGQLHNTNRLLDTDGIFAGKTGFTDEAGHGVLILAQVEMNGTAQTVAVAMLGQGSYAAAFDGAQILLDSVGANLTARVIVRQGQKVGQITNVWPSGTDLIAGNDLTATTWVDQPADVEITDYQVGGQQLPAGAPVGNISADGQAVNVTTKNNIVRPSLLWRLGHGF